MAVIAFPTLEGWQYVTLISPFFIYVLLTRVSGVNLLEQRADQKWGGDEDYEIYKKNTPVLIPYIK
jgi:Predicted membrane protein